MREDGVESGAGVTTAKNESLPAQAASAGRRKSIGATTLIRLEIKYEDIEMVTANIGRGAFGDVHKAKWNGVDVAIKQVSERANERKCYTWLHPLLN